MLQSSIWNETSNVLVSSDIFNVIFFTPNRLKTLGASKVLFGIQIYFIRFHITKKKNYCKEYVEE